MKTKPIFLIAVLIFSMLFNSYSQSSTDRPWDNKKCAISLTYDDGLNIHLDQVIPLLDSMGFHGTFYIPGYASSLGNRLNDWRKAAGRGHELGNHTLYHACIGGIPGREWVNPNYDLSKYSVKRMVDEVLMANILLSAIDGKQERTFAYTCGDTKIDTVLFMDLMKDKFIAARGVKNIMKPIQDINIYEIGSFMMMNNTSEDMIALVKEAMKTKSYLVFLFHGVGGEHSINVSSGEHRKLLEFLKQNQKDIWVAPFIEISNYIKAYQDKNTGN